MSFITWVLQETFQLYIVLNKGVTRSLFETTNNNFVRNLLYKKTLRTHPLTSKTVKLRKQLQKYLR